MLRAPVAVLLAFLIAPLAEAQRIEVFTVTAHPVRTAGVAVEAVYRLDAIAQTTARWSAGLPNDPEKAKAIVISRMRSDADTVAALEPQAQGLIKAVEYGVSKVPAIVFDGAVVIYGVTDVARAVALWQARRE